MRPAFAALALLAVAAWGQTRRQTPPVFQSNTSLVQITVIVSGRGGKPVTGLNIENFSLQANGQLRPISVFSINDNRVPTAPVTAAASSGRRVYTNQTSHPPQMVVVLFDPFDSAGGMQYASGQPTFNSTLSFTWARERALHYLETLPPNEDVALYGLDSGLHLLADFTTDRTRLVAALKGYHPVAPTFNVGAGPPTDVPGDFNGSNGSAASSFAATRLAHHRQITFQALTRIAAHLAAYPGRSSLVWMLSSPPLSGSLVEAALGYNNRIAVYPVDVRGLLAREGVEAVSGNDSPDDGLSLAAAAARLAVQPIGQGAMLQIADTTGGRAYINTNDIGGAIAQAAQDSAYSYTLGFYLPSKDVDHRFHKLHVSLHGVKHAEVRYPHGFWASSTGGAARTRSIALLAALDNPGQAMAVPLTAKLKPDPNGGTALLADIGLAHVTFQTEDGYHDAAVLVVVLVQDLKGNFLGGSQKLLHLHCPDTQFPALLRTGLRVGQSLTPIPGATQIRLLAEDATSGLVGSLIVPLPSLKN